MWQIDEEIKNCCDTGTLYILGIVYNVLCRAMDTILVQKMYVKKNLSNANSMQVGGKDVKVLTFDSCVKSSKRSYQKESHCSGILFCRHMYITGS